MRRSMLFTALWATTSLAGTPAASPTAAAPVVRFDSGTVSGLGARNIGSAAMSGRVAAIAAHLEDGKTTVYVGAASGGVWKSTDGGTTFKPVFDKQPVQAIGAITLDPSNPEVVWVGTGESWTRNSVSVGNGLYKSTDGGETWTHMGLPESERINRILVHPKNPDVVYVCVPGKLWSDSAERGLYKTADGGKSWSLVLKGKNLSTGCSGLTMDPGNPDVLFAGLWDFRRKGWTFRSGGEGPDAASGSGLFRTSDGGKTWTALTRDTASGLPKQPWGRLEVEIAPSNPNRVYAFIESTGSALYVSDDGGKSWEERDKSQMMVWRPFYFANLVVDPANPDRLFKMNLGLIVSEDGGRSFSGSGGGSHGDWHDLWINPQNPKHLIGGDDGGLWTSYDGGNRWWKNSNLPISQFYHVSTDNQDPYQVYGGLQDNSSWVGDSAYPGGITNNRWENLYGGDGFWVFPDPSDPDYVYAESQGGYVGRVNRRTHASRDLQPKAGYGEKLRFNWNTPLHLSPNEKGTLYIGAQFLFRTRDHGQSWERISPDLTTNDPQKQKQEQSGGVTVDNSSAEMHTTIYSISESPRNGGVIWVGTDDGNVQLTRDGGKTWTNVTGNLKGVPKASWVSWVEASRFDEGTAYVTLDRHTFGDVAPYVFKTTDFGKTWTRIAGPQQGLRGYAHVVKEDVLEKDLLFVGTEYGLWISIDGGKRWAEFKGGNFPSVAVRDLVVHGRENDVVLATHGRGIWIIDDLTPLRELSDGLLEKDAAFLSARPVQQRMPGSGGWVEGDASFSGENPPGGAVITYYQKTRHLFGPIKLEILDPEGKVIDTIPASKRRGINRVSWSMRVAPPRSPRAAQLAYNATQGPRVLPGSYTVRLTKGDKVYETKLDIGLDRRAAYTLEDRKAQFDAAMRVHAMFGEMTDLTERIQFVRTSAGRLAEKLPEKDALRRKLEGVEARGDELRKKIVATKEGGAITGEERLREHMDSLYGAILSYEGRPASYQLERIGVLQRELEDVTKAFASLTAQLPELNASLKAKGLPEIGSPPVVAPAAQLSSGDVETAFGRFLGLPVHEEVRFEERD
ncbi:VPS10 domain-containing protein [Archangium sp.]|uniref:VPS10 domain-containing protein n=1 Tax=Archangium sp. TaxID=1872627 RepID=UPI00389A57DE